MENPFGHTWCNCLECDQRVEALRLLLVGRVNRDDALMLVFTHHAHTAETTYVVFGEVYHLLHRFGEIQDPQLVHPDEDEDDDDEDWDPDDRI